LSGGDVRGEVVLKYPHIDAADHILRKEFFEGGVCPTVGMLLITKDAKGYHDGLVLVRPLQDLTFMPPQGGIQFGETPRTAIRRECAEEFLGLEIDIEDISQEPVYQGINPLPSERHETAGYRAKYMAYFTVPVVRRPHGVNPKENADLKFIFDPHAFFSTISCCRGPKRDAICSAIDGAVQQGHLNWDAGIVRRHLNKIAAAA